MKNLDVIRELVEEGIYVSLEIEDLTDMLMNELGFSAEDAAEIANNVYEQVQDAEDEVRSDLIFNISNYIQSCVQIRDEKLHPEDCPWQLHLFEYKG